MLKKIDHIGIAVKDLEKAMEIYQALSGRAAGHKETVEAQKVQTAFFPVGEVRLELLQGTAADSPITKFIEKRGEGFHHICFEVEDLDAARNQLTARGFQFVAGISEQGAGGSKVAFIHPKSTGGLLVELVEYPPASGGESV